MRRILIAADHDGGLTENYFAAVEAAGAEAVALPPGAPLPSALDGIDGVVLKGGQDIDPALYHEENTASVQCDRAEDERELMVLRYAVFRRIPVLGVCRGMQLMNVFFGGTLIQDVERTDLHTWEDGKDRVHVTRVKRGSFLHQIYQEERITVNSAHHQAIRQLGAGLVPVQWTGDGVIEAVAHVSLPVFGVQWHPERLRGGYAREDAVDGGRVFAYLVAG